MCLAIREKRVSSAIIVDMAPDSKKPNSLFEAYVKSMQRIDQAHVKSLIEADILLKPDIPEPEIRQFLLTNLKVNDKGVFKFRLNLDAIDKQMYKLWQFGFNEKCLKPVLFVAGVKSSYITRNMYTGIKNQFVNAEFHEMETGHW